MCRLSIADCVRDLANGQVALEEEAGGVSQTRRCQLSAEGRPACIREGALQLARRTSQAACCCS
jgi:hypothetical protein